MSSSYPSLILLQVIFQLFVQLVLGAYKQVNDNTRNRKQYGRNTDIGYARGRFST